MAGCQHYLATSGLGLNSTAEVGLDRWSAAPTADIGFHGPSVGSLAMLIIGCTVGELSCFLCLGLMESTKNGDPTRELVAGMSYRGRAGGGRAQCAGLLMDARA